LLSDRKEILIMGEKKRSFSKEKGSNRSSFIGVGGKREKAAKEKGPSQRIGKPGDEHWRYPGGPSRLGEERVSWRRDFIMRGEEGRTLRHFEGEREKGTASAPMEGVSPERRKGKGQKESRLLPNSSRKG